MIFFSFADAGGDFDYEGLERFGGKLAALQGLEALLDLQPNVRVENGPNVPSDGLGGTKAGNCFGGPIERVDGSVETGSDQAGVDRFDYTFVQEM